MKFRTQVQDLIWTLKTQDSDLVFNIIKRTFISDKIINIIFLNISIYTYIYSLNTKERNMRNTRNIDEELFKENNDHCYTKHTTGVSRARTLAFRNGCKSKSLDIFDRPGSLATTQSMSTPSISRRQLTRVKSLASIPENSVQQTQVHSLIY